MQTALTHAQVVNVDQEFVMEAQTEFRDPRYRDSFRRFTRQKGSKA